MSRNGSGVYNLPAGNPVVTGTTITTTWANSTLTDIASALTGSVAADGQTPMTSSLNMANNKVISVTDPTSAQDAATKAYVDLVADGTKSGSFVNLAYTGTLTGSTGVIAIGTNQIYKDASGNIGLGTVSPLSLGGKTFQVENSTLAGIIWSDGTRIGQLLASSTANISIGSRSNHELRLATNDTERMRISSGGFFYVNQIGQLGNTQQRMGLQFDSSVEWGLNITSSNTATGNAVNFTNSSGTQIGQIQVSTTATAYVTSSDYRLKENIAPMTGALDLVAQLKPVTYTWKSTGENGQGFIAHELQSVVSDCVTGKKDAVDAEGKPVYQGIDTSFLVATLTAAIQEQQTMINELKAKVAALEAA
jgi:hypothetical protein